MAARKKQFKTKGKVSRHGDWGVIQFADHAYSFEIAGNMLLAGQSILPLATRNHWENQALRIGEYNIIPNGPTNQLPYELRDVLEDNNLTEGTLRRQRGLMWGQGPALYKEEIVDNEVQRIWVKDPEIEAWLKSFNYKEQLRKAIVDYNHTEGHYARFHRNLGARIPGNRAMIAKIEHVGYHRARLEWPEDGLNWQHIIVGDWYNPNLLGLSSYPVFDPTKPFAFPVSMTYCNMNSFCRDFYGLPGFWGALSWIRQGSTIPKILEALTKNSLNIKWHIKSPASYWEAKRQQLEDRCVSEGKTYKAEMLEDLKDSVFEDLAKVLAGADNVGKFFESETSFTDSGLEEGWKIEAIDTKTKDFIESQILIAKQAESAITAGMGLHPSLANIMVDGKLASGSEQLYALKNYLATEIDIPEMIICQPYNWAIEVNFPGRGLQLGFFHQVVKTESNVTPPDRMKNAI